MSAKKNNSIRYAEEVDELTEGTTFHFSGKITDDCERFEINFLLNNESNDIAVHINPRFSENCVVRNTRTYKGWDDVEERNSAVPFALFRGVTFDILVVVTEDCYLISINGQHLAEFHHRLSYEMVRFLEVKGGVEDVHVNRSEFRAYPRLQDAVACFDSRSTEVPYSYHLKKTEPLCEGDNFNFSGKIAKNCKRFEINFLFDNNTEDIALHINPRFLEKRIIRNTRLYKMWGTEEISSPLPFPFSLGDNFDIQVLVTDDCYLISTNGCHYTSFTHRLKYGVVKRIEIVGGVEKVEIEHTKVVGYPKRLEVEEMAHEVEELSENVVVLREDPAIGDEIVKREATVIREETIFTQPLDKLSEGDKISVEGKLSLDCVNFEITLKCADESENCTLPSSLLRGEKFNFKVFVKKDCYMISINDKHFAKCLYQYPYQSVRFVEIKGDFKEVQVNHTKKLNLLESAKKSRVSAVCYINKLVKTDSFTFCGEVAINCERFEINFHDKCRQNIALHVSPQFADQCVVRSSKLQDFWKKSECASSLPFMLKQGDKFKVQVLVAENGYLISINDQHFAEYTHRMPYEDVQIAEIKGNLENVKILHTQELDYPKQLPESAVSIDKYSETLSICNVAYGIDELNEGDSLVFSGKTTINCNKFEINFMCKNDTRDIALHISARLQQQWIARNCRTSSMWGPEERYSTTPFLLSRGDKFAIQVLVTNDSYLISVNGHYFAKFLHRIPYKKVWIFEVKGDVEIVQICRSIYNEHSGSEVNDVAISIYRIAEEIAELKEGERLGFTGKVAKNCKQFEINFIHNNDARDIALHIEPRFLEKCILRNTRLNDSWGSEERLSALPFLLKCGENFTIQVLVTDEFYLISINGHHFTEYPHRVSYRNVRILEVKGDVEEVQIHRNSE